MTQPRDIEAIAAALRAFAEARDWEQFHTPKNLVMALGGEAGELLALFQWLTPGEAASVMQVPVTARAVQEELADVFIYLVRLADVLGIDLVQAAWAKIEANEHRYPAAAVRGKAIKYTDVETDG
jgi:NTP pyrophosphatase (non-canonical NTP hydrolase)